MNRYNCMFSMVISHRLLPIQEFRNIIDDYVILYRVMAYRKRSYYHYGNFEIKTIGNDDQRNGEANDDGKSKRKGYASHAETMLVTLQAGLGPMGRFLLTGAGGASPRPRMSPTQRARWRWWRHRPALPRSVGRVPVRMPRGEGV